MAQPGYQTVTFREVVLRKLRVRAQHSLTGMALASADAFAIVDHVTDRLVLQVEAELLADDRDGKTFTIEEKPVYESWLDQLHHSLPEDGLRWRFLTYYRGTPPRMKRVRHEIDVKVSDTFPESTMALARQLGPPRVAIQLHDTPAYYEVP